jgi:hypothetical protein
MRRPTLDEFLVNRWPTNSYVDYPGFKSLYVRKGDIAVTLNNEMHRCINVLTIGAATAMKPGSGAFTALVEDLVSRGLAIYVECVHNPRFADKLLRMGFTRVSPIFGFCKKGLAFLQAPSYYKLTVIDNGCGSTSAHPNLNKSFDAHRA